jgi:predicted Fe-Mo cluster-binding NifX family protein
MKVAVTAREKDLNSAIDPRFGRCFYFMLVDLKSNETEIIDNLGEDVSGGAGIQTAQKLVKKNIEAVITGSVGPNAMEILQAAGIKVYQAVESNVKENLTKFQAGELNLITTPNADKKAGLKSWWK